MSNYPPPGPPPFVPSAPCRHCFTPIPFGTRVCPRCGAATDFVPVAQRANNAGPSFLGVAVTLLVWFVIPGFVGSLLANRGYASGFTALQSLGSLLVLGLLVGLPIFSIVLLVRNPRQSPWRAFGFAALITTCVILGLAVLLVGGLFLLCSLGGKNL